MTSQDYTNPQVAEAKRDALLTTDLALARKALERWEEAQKFAAGEDQ